MPVNRLSDLENALNFSHYLQRTLTAQPDLTTKLSASLSRHLTTEDFEQSCLWANLNEEELKKQLRILRQYVFSHILIRDLNQQANLFEVTQTISLFADFAVNTALNFAQQQYEKQYGHPIGEDSHTPQSLTVIAMGKLGGFELNVSSDIDLIFTYPESGQTNGEKTITNHEFFLKVGQKLIALLDDITSDGQVFRVDMRLRPNGDSGPLVISETGLEQYLISQGREWERYAWIKARVITKGAHNITELVRPFVYRKYLDFNAYEAMRDLHQQIRLEVTRKNKEKNIKLGSGGIREAEFVTQIFQLIWGGKNKSLQLRGTQETLEELARLHYLTEDQKNNLLTAYQFLRHLEHRLQYFDDQQTQTLPTQTEHQEKIAHSMNFKNYEQFLDTLSTHQNIIKTAFDATLSQNKTSEDTHPLNTLWTDTEDPQLTINTLNRLGFDGVQIQLRLKSLKQSSKYIHLSTHAQTLFDKLIPLIIQTTSKSDHANTALIRFLDFLENISRRSSYLALLCEHPETLAPLTNIFAASSWVSNYLMRHPILLDELLDIRLIQQKPDWVELAKELKETLNAHPKGDVEAKMDTLRHFQHAQVFKLAVQDLNNAWQLEFLSDELSLLATTIIQAAFEQVWKGLKNKHCEEPKLAVIAYGKLGGKEMSYASDLDLVFIYDDPHPDAVETYTRFTRRLNTWLSSTSGAGNLYSVDLRLRPNGDAGLIVSSLESFTYYQKNEAWVWEHQALTRARFICGDEHIGIAFEDLRKNILTSSKDAEHLHDEILIMRDRITETHPPQLTNVKYARGGVVDVEFLVQYLILKHAATHPILTQNYGNIALLAMAAECGLIESDLAEQTRIAYRAYRKIQHTANLRDIRLETVNDDLLAQYAVVKKLWHQVFYQEI